MIGAKTVATSVKVDPKKNEGTYPSGSEDSVKNEEVILENLDQEGVSGSIVILPD